MPQLPYNGQANDSANEDFDKRFAEAKGGAAEAAETGFAGLTRKLHELVEMQTAEIERLRNVITDGVTIPERHPTAVSLATYTSAGRERRDVLAIGSDKNVWFIADVPTHPDAVKHHPGWVRLPPLPQAADEMESGK